MALDSLIISTQLLLLLSICDNSQSRYGYNSRYREPPLYTICKGGSYRDLPVEVQNEHQCLILEQLQVRVRKDLDSRRMQYTDINAHLHNLETKLTYTLRRLNKRRDPPPHFPGLKDIPIAKDCNELKTFGIQHSGIYPIEIPSGAIVNVYCDMDTDGGGWTVVQQRAKGLVNFTRKWDDYAYGFGNVNNEFWIGNENLYSMTSETRYSLKVELWDWDDQMAYAQYDTFHVDHATTNYRLTVEGFREDSTAGDSLKHHSGMSFSTIDRDNDKWRGSCAKVDRSGWWFNRCSFCSLNGEYQHPGINIQIAVNSRQVVSNTLNTDKSQTSGITWFSWTKRPNYSLMRVQMKIKPHADIIVYDEMMDAAYSGEDEAVFH